MNIIEIIITGVGLSMDAFAVAICKGLSMKKIDYKKIIIIGLYFGLFQAIMPLIGYLLGSSFSGFIESIDHWIAFGLLSLIGFNMIKESFSNELDSNNDDVSFKVMIPLAVATSIDALAVGITFAFLKVNIIISVLIIGIITFLICIIGVFIGNKFGNKYEKKSRIVGGIILIIIGIKILVEHLGFI